MANTRFGSAVWEGGLKSGGGHVSSESGALHRVPYGFNTRFEGKKGSNPEELVGAAHASCFAMATALMLEQAGIEGVEVEAKSAVTIDEGKDGFAITRAALTATVSGRGDEATLRKAAEDAKTGCPISKLLNTEITLDLTVKAS